VAKNDTMEFTQGQLMREKVHEMENLLSQLAQRTPLIGKQTGQVGILGVVELRRLSLLFELVVEQSKFNHSFMAWSMEAMKLLFLKEGGKVVPADPNREEGQITQKEYQSEIEGFLENYRSLFVNAAGIVFTERVVDSMKEAFGLKDFPAKVLMTGALPDPKKEEKPLESPETKVFGGEFGDQGTPVASPDFVGEGFEKGPAVPLTPPPSVQEALEKVEGGTWTVTDVKEDSIVPRTKEEQEKMYPGVPADQIKIAVYEKELSKLRDVKEGANDEPGA